MVSYKDSGVNIEEADAFTSNLNLNETFNSNVIPFENNFAFMYDLGFLKTFKSPILLTSTDGVGTKLELAEQLKKYDTIGIDLVAMCVNDLLVHGGLPHIFLDYYATPELKKEIASKIIDGIKEGCRQSGCVLGGGETAEMPGIYPKGKFDLAGFTIGFGEKENILPQNIQSGDYILGLKSSGVHSNGFSLIRHLIKENKLQLTEDLLEPTKIYVDECKSILNSIKGLVHITGGGFKNLDRITTNYKLFDWKFNELFSNIQQASNLTRVEMLSIFNCGYGMLIITDTLDLDVNYDVIGKIL